jgi:hypothetical protein
MKTYNWKPVIGSLLKVLQDHNFVLYSTNNGEARVFFNGLTPRQARQLAKAEIVATDESGLYVTHPSYPDKFLWIYIVLGNEPEETVADYTVNDLLELALDQFSKKWENKPCPTY